jgi:hypothetical protein
MTVWDQGFDETVVPPYTSKSVFDTKGLYQVVLRIRIFRIRFHMYLGIPDPDPLLIGMDRDPDPSINMQK